MKKVEIKGEVTKIVYEAIDGTQFDDQKECEKYDKSAECVLLSKYNKLVIKKEICEESLFGVGSCDCYYDIVKVDTQEKADILKQTFMFYNPGTSEERFNKKFDIIDRALKEDDFIIVQRNTYGDDNFWIFDSVNNYYEDLKKNCEPKQE